MVKSIADISPIRIGEGGLKPGGCGAFYMATPSGTPLRAEQPISVMAPLGLSPICKNTAPPQEEETEVVETARKVTSTPNGAGTGTGKWSSVCKWV